MSKYFSKYFLKLYRQKNNYTIAYVSNYLGIHRDTYSYYEEGIRDLPTSILIKLCALYQITPNDLLNYANKKTANLSDHDKDTLFSAIEVMKKLIN